jgi:riboflavin synthase
VFTGLIDAVGTISTTTTTGAGRELRIACPYHDVDIGESIAVNGACLTARERGSGWFAAAAVVTTLERTMIGSWAAGQPVNLERALRVGDRFGGHLVQGHVDAVGRVERVEQRGDALLVDVALPEALESLVVLRGSIAIDGVSLTVNALPGARLVQLALIDHTLRQTTLGGLRPGDRVHVETDQIGKYLQRMAAPWLSRP